jgi:hypothetical protein
MMNRFRRDWWGGLVRSGLLRRFAPRNDREGANRERIYLSRPFGARSIGVLVYYFFCFIF